MTLTTYYAINRTRPDGKFIRDTVIDLRIVTLVNDSSPRTHILPIERGLRQYGIEQIDLTRRPREIAYLLEELGFKEVNISDRIEILRASGNDLKKDAWRGFASYCRTPFGILYPVIYDFPLLKSS